MILITGGAGFIGSNLSLSLRSKGYDVTIVDNLSPQIHGDIPFNSSLYYSIKGMTDFIYADITNKIHYQHNLLNAFQKADTLVLLAAETGTGQSMYDVHKYINTNISSNGLILDLIINNKLTNIKKIVFASSRAVYGEGKYSCLKHGIFYPKSRLEDNLSKGIFDVLCPECGEVSQLIPTNENTPLEPSSIYGISKSSQEQIISLMCKTLGISYVGLRYQNVYGPGQSLSNPYTGILSIFSTRILNGNPIDIFEDGLESRDFVYIDDVVDATIKSIEFDSNINEILNVGSGISTSVLDVANGLKKLYDKQISVTITGKYRLGDIRHNVADLIKIKKILNWNPKISFNDGLKKFTDWVKIQPIQSDEYEKSILELKSKKLIK